MSLSPDIEGLEKFNDRRSAVARYRLAKQSNGDWVTVYRSKAVLFRNLPGKDGGVVMELNHQGTTDSVVSVVKLLLGVK